MADNTWYMDIESKIFTIVKGKTYSKLKADFPKIRYTTNDENIEPITVFPTVYIHEISGTPMGSDLEGIAVNGVMSTFEVRVTTNTNKSDSKAVASAISEAFCSLGFQPTSLPISASNNNMFIYNSRYRRVIGVDDTI